MKFLLLEVREIFDMMAGDRVERARQFVVESTALAASIRPAITGGSSERRAVFQLHGARGRGRMDVVARFVVRQAVVAPLLGESGLGRCAAPACAALALCRRITVRRPR